MKQEPLVEVWSRDLFETRNISERFQYAVSILVFFYVNTEEGFGYPRRSDAHKRRTDRGRRRKLSAALHTWEEIRAELVKLAAYGVVSVAELVRLARKATVAPKSEHFIRDLLQTEEIGV